MIAFERDFHTTISLALQRLRSAAKTPACRAVDIYNFIAQRQEHAASQHHKTHILREYERFLNDI
jgi:hypothetical protein